MQGDFSVLHFDPRRDARPVAGAPESVLRNLSGVLQQQGRVTLDADQTEGELFDLAWQGQAGRDIIGAGVCAVPAADPQAFRVDAVSVSAGVVHVWLHPGRAWADGILARLAGLAPDAAAAVERSASPLAPSAPIAHGARDAVVLEVSEESLHAFQYPERLLEAALGGPDTAERAYVNLRLRLLRLAAGEDCRNIGARLSDDPAALGRLSVSLAPPTAIPGDCPVSGGGGYTGFEHCLYRIEVADVPPAAPPRFKWSQWNGGLVGRGRFDATAVPARVIIDAGRAAIVSAGLSGFYLEALEYDALAGAWRVVYGAPATLNTEHDLELASPPSFGALPATAEPVFFRLWNGIADVAAFPDSGAPAELGDGIRLAFAAPTASNYRPGDYWTFTVRAGGIDNPLVLVDAAPPAGIVYHRVALAEVLWSLGPNGELSGAVEDCRQVFPPLTAGRRGCCTLRVGDGHSSFGDFDSLEEAAAHLPADGGELCLLPGLHRANLRLEGRRRVRIHGCAWRTMIIPRPETRELPLLHIVDCGDIDIGELDLLTYDGIAVRIDGREEGRCHGLRIHDTRVIARTNAIRASGATDLAIAANRLHLLDTASAGATISSACDDVLIERNTLLVLPFVERPPGRPGEPDGTPPGNPADPCARREELYRDTAHLLRYALAVWGFAPDRLVAHQPYRAWGGIHVRAGSERMRILENRIAGGRGNGITLGGDLAGDAGPPPPSPDTPPADGAAPVVDHPGGAPMVALLRDGANRPLPDVDLFAEGDRDWGDRSDAQGLASIKAPQGRYVLAVAPPHRIVRMEETRDEAGPLRVLTLAAAPPRASVGRGFLHQVDIEHNDIAAMGLSAIGFALRAGAAPAEPAPTGVAGAALPADLDAALAALAVTALLRATDPVRGLVIERNRLHDNLHGPLGREELAQLQAIGRGGISLAIVDGALIRANEVLDNGAGAEPGLPACGIFAGYGDRLEIVDNDIAGNGRAFVRGAGFEGAAIRGGIHIRFAAALTARLSTSSGRHPALRLHGNRVDQPVGRAFTAYAFGPVSVANNHFNSEAAGLGAVLDTVGVALLYNLGGIHRRAARLHAGLLTHAGAFAAAANGALPGGETLFDDNCLRQGLVHASGVSHLLLCADDLGYASNTSSVYRGDPLAANAMLAADTLRATGARFSEDVTRTISLFTLAVRMNTTAHNQADHCIVVLPAAGPGPLPTVEQPNQVLDPNCRALFAEPESPWRHLLQGFGGFAAPPGGPAEAGITDLAGRFDALAAAAVGANRLALARAYREEAARLAWRHGAHDPLAPRLAAGAEGATLAGRLLAATAETLAITEPETPPEGASLAARVVNDRGQGLPGYAVELLRANGQALEPLGLSDEAGFIGAAYDRERVLALQREGSLNARVFDRSGGEVLRSRDSIAFAPGARLRLTLVVPLRAVPREAPPSCPESPPGPGPRTSLDRLQLDERTRGELEQAHIHDVECILELDAGRLAALLGSQERARKLADSARKLLGQEPP
ncbi:MAG: DUF6519 domain-containing protein [Pseudomonadota bacterium]